MRVEDIMSRDPVHCGPDSSLREVAVKMVEFDCGEIPICDDAGKPIGVITDRDIVCRVVAKGHDPLQSRAGEYMSAPVITTSPDTPIDECVRLMEQFQVRRLPVVDGGGIFCGMLAQADVARHAAPDTIAEVMEHVSEPNAFASSVGGR